MQKIRRNIKLFIQEESNVLQTSTIRTVHELNEKFRLINDIYSFHNLIEELSAHIPKVIFDKDKFCKFTRRLIEAICFALERYAYDFSRTAFLVETLTVVKTHWKKVLAAQFSQGTERKNLKNFKFTYILHKNEFMLYVLKGSNAIIEKQIFRLIKNSSINIKSLIYLKKCYIKNIWAKIHQEMIEVAKETENQTYLKIKLLTEFLKHTLFQVNFCLTQNDFDLVYQRMFEIAGHSFRIIKKFYSLDIMPLIRNVKQIILKAIVIYREISFQFPNKFRYLTNLMRLFEQKRPKSKRQVTITVNLKQEQNNFVENSQTNQNPKAYAIKLTLRLMASWKKVKAKKDKEKLLREKSSMMEMCARTPQFHQKTAETQKRQKFLAGLQKEQFFLKSKAKRSASLQNYKTQELPQLHNIQIRKQIQDQIDKQFGKLKYLKTYTPQPPSKSSSKKKLNTSQRSLYSTTKQKKRSFSLKQTLGIRPSTPCKTSPNDEKQVNIQDYKQKLNLCRKQITNLNRIRLYHPEKHSLVPHGGSGGMTQKGASSREKGAKASVTVDNNRRKLLPDNKEKGRLRL